MIIIKIYTTTGTNNSPVYYLELVFPKRDQQEVNPQLERPQTQWVNQLQSLNLCTVS